MAGEYYRWLARNEKPEEKRELTPKEKRKNWWYYHKWHVLIGAVAVCCLASLVIGNLKSKLDQPDYAIAYIGSTPLPSGTVETLEAALAELGEDLNKNGEVRVDIHQYLIYAEGNDDAQTNLKDDTASYVYADKVQLLADLERCESFFFLMEDPERFQTDYQILCWIDGSEPGEDLDSDRPLYVAWADCPVLAGLPLGNYTEQILGQRVTGSNQELLSGLYIARRGFWQNKTPDNLEGCNDLWHTMLEGAYE